MDSLATLALVNKALDNALPALAQIEEYGFVLNWTLASITIVLFNAMHVGIEGLQHRMNTDSSETQNMKQKYKFASTK